jgi:hypothetical protein
MVVRVDAVALLTSCPDSVCTSNRPDHSFSPLVSLPQLGAVSTGLAPLRSHADDVDAAAAAAAGGGGAATAAASPAVVVVVLLAVSVSAASSTVLLRSLCVR